MMDTDLRQEMWNCLRLWLYDYRYFRPDSSPFPDLAKYGPPAAAFHALTHWKFWMARKSAFTGVKLEALYDPTIYNSRSKNDVTLFIPADGREYKSVSCGRDRYHDYVLRKHGDPQPEILCAAEVEDGTGEDHLTEDLQKLVTERSRLKVMVYRMTYRNPKRRNSFEKRCGQRKQAIENMIDAEPAYTGSQDFPREDWLFIGFPYYSEYPKHGDETDVQIHTLRTPCESISLVKPDWNIWQFPHEMDQWIRSMSSYSAAFPDDAPVEIGASEWTVE